MSDLNERLDRFAEGEAPDLWADILTRADEPVIPSAPLQDPRSSRPLFLVAAALLLVVGGVGLALSSLDGGYNQPDVAAPPAPGGDPSELPANAWQLRWPTANQMLDAGGDRAERLESCLQFFDRATPGETDDLYSEGWPTRAEILDRGAVELYGSDASPAPSNLPQDAATTWIFNIDEGQYQVICDGGAYDGGHRNSRITISPAFGSPESDGISAHESYGEIIGVAGSDVTDIEVYLPNGDLFSSFPTTGSGWFVVRRSELPDFDSPNSLLAKVTEQDGRVIWNRPSIGWTTTDGRWATAPVNVSTVPIFGSCAALQDCEAMIDRSIPLLQGNAVGVAADRSVTLEEFETVAGFAQACILEGEQELGERTDENSDQYYGMERQCTGDRLGGLLNFVDIQTSAATPIPE